jgi:dCMP deaminase
MTESATVNRQSSIVNRQSSIPDRPTWDSYLSALAVLAATRSHDPDTKHGAVIVDEHNRILGQGYNGLPRGGDESQYPLTRPAKYPYMVHAEVNAILNCAHRPEGGTIYVTGCPCTRCMLEIIQVGLVRVVYGNLPSDSVQQEEQAGVALLARNHHIKLVHYQNAPLLPLITAIELLGVHVE